MNTLYVKYISPTWEWVFRPGSHGEQVQHQLIHEVLAEGTHHISHAFSSLEVVHNLSTFSESSVAYTKRGWPNQLCVHVYVCVSVRAC